MSRGLFAGFTDYSHQSLFDIVSDLRIWRESLNTSVKFLDDLVAEIKKNYWSNVPNFYKNYMFYCIKFFNTAVVELDDIIPQLNSVQENHIKRLRKISNVAHRINIDIGKMWHQEYPDKYIDYENFYFLKVERVYHEIRGMAADLLDLDNAAGRLEDFIGRTDLKEKNRTVNDIFEFKPNFYGVGININNLIRKIFKKSE